MFRKLSCSAMALMLLAATATVSDARGRRGVGVGAAIVGTVIGLGIAGAIARDREDPYYHRSSCYPGPRQCQVVGTKCWRDDYGARQCRDDVRCWRPEICD